MSHQKVMCSKEWVLLEKWRSYLTTREGRRSRVQTFDEAVYIDDAAENSRE